MPIKTEPWDAAEILHTPEHVAAYLEVWLEDGSAAELNMALDTIARTGVLIAPGTEAARLVDLVRERIRGA